MEMIRYTLSIHDANLAALLNNIFNYLASFFVSRCNNSQTFQPIKNIRNNGCIAISCFHLFNSVAIL